ncbi:DUF6086 family protein [Streptomyces sp. NPDC091217]|uniref:DUF6086 family protein n=1 Tax=Streptomyces sp. NPDC091217 TaxID=3365975 RepID=UPI00382EA672
MRFYGEIESHLTRVLWEPQEAVARLFRGHLETVSGLLGAPSRIRDLPDGNCAVDIPGLEEFCDRAIAEYHRSDQGIFRSLTVGFIATVMVLLDRAGCPMPDVPDAPRSRAWAALRDEHALAMPQPSTPMV